MYLDQQKPTVVIWSIDDTLFFKAGACQIPSLKSPHYVCKNLNSHRPEPLVIPHMVWFRLVFKILAQCGIKCVLASPLLSQDLTKAKNRVKVEALYADLKTAFPDLENSIIQGERLEEIKVDHATDLNHIISMQCDHYAKENPDNVIWVGANTDNQKNIEFSGCKFIPATTELEHLYHVLEATIGHSRALSELNESHVDKHLTYSDILTFQKHFFNQPAVIFHGYLKKHLLDIIKTLSPFLQVSAKLYPNESKLATLKDSISKVQLPALSEFQATLYLQNLIVICEAKNYFGSARKIIKPAARTDKLIQELNQPCYLNWKKLITQQAGHLNYDHLLVFAFAVKPPSAALPDLTVYLQPQILSIIRHLCGNLFSLKYSAQLQELELIRRKILSDEANLPSENAKKYLKEVVSVCMPGGISNPLSDILLTLLNSSNWGKLVTTEDDITFKALVVFIMSGLSLEEFGLYDFPTED